MARDAHARSPDHMRALFKRWQKSTIAAIDQADDIWDFSRLPSNAELELIETKVDRTAQIIQGFDDFLQDHGPRPVDSAFDAEFTRYEVKSLPGLLVYPALLPADVQTALLDKLLHRDLSHQSHRTNLHLHYHIPYKTRGAPSVPSDFPNSFFLTDQHDVLSPKDPAVHKPITIRQMLERKLRWITLGGQYDWSAKVYPCEQSPQFPDDIKRLLTSLFPNVDAQAAIVNFYTPGDTLSVHRDVSEECDQGLISISIGCDGIFIIGSEHDDSAVSIRLRSGDVVLMTGDSRFAWHAVPKVLPDTCPGWLYDWPHGMSKDSLEAWKGWMRRKRININVRQMKD